MNLSVISLTMLQQWELLELSFFILLSMQIILKPIISFVLSVFDHFLSFFPSFIISSLVFSFDLDTRSQVWYTPSSVLCLSIFTYSWEHHSFLMFHSHHHLPFLMSTKWVFMRMGVTTYLVPSIWSISYLKIWLLFVINTMSHLVLVLTTRNHCLRVCKSY